MLIGADYYPEQWDKERWALDAALMHDMGITAVRIGEFGWSVLEREEGKLDFSLFDEAISLLGEYGIKTVFGIPTAAPPAWLCARYPDIFMEDKYHLVRGFGTRRHYCYNHAGYCKEAARITREIVNHYNSNENVIAWQIDNELGCEDGVRCYCENCRKAFIKWLQNKYGSLNELNQSWGTVFWSQVYTSWDQIILPAQSVTDEWTKNSHNPGLLLDHARFSSDALIRFAKSECDVIRAISNKPVIHNMVSENCDNYQLGALLDRVGYDAYPQSQWDQNSPGKISFLYDLTKSFNPAPAWILEQQSGPCGWNDVGITPETRQYALWAVRAVSKGAEALFYFRWRSSLYGAEQYWYGILDHDGVPRDRYQALLEANCFIRQHEKILRAPEDRQVLVIYDYENKYIHDFQPHLKGFSYQEELIRIYEALIGCHLSAGLGNTDTDLTPYPLVIFPNAALAEEDTVRRCESYVYQGGNLLLTSRSGMRRANNQITDQTLPGIWSELAGITVEEFAVRSMTDGYGMEQHLWFERLQLHGAKPFIKQQAVFQGTASVSVHHVGKGHVFYAGSTDIGWKSVIEAIRAYLQLKVPGLPEEIECITKNGQDTIMLFNHSGEPTQINLPGYREVDTQMPVTVLNPFSYVIVER